MINAHRILSPVLLFSGLFLNTANAASILDISVDDRTPTGTRGSIFSDYLEAESLSTVRPVTISGNTLSFTHQMQHYAGFYVPENGSNFALIGGAGIEYFISFTISDPQNIGYSLSLDTLNRGYGTTRVDNGGRARFSNGSTFVRVDSRGPQGGAWTSGANINTPAPNIARRFDEDAVSVGAGSYTGTRSFSVFIDVDNSFNFENNTDGQISSRFGLSNINPVLDTTGKPQDGDISDDDLGYFLTVNASFNGDIVPEPSSVLLLCFGGLGFISRRAR